MNGVFPVICSYCSITIWESSCWLQPKTEGKRTSPPLCHTHALGAERGAQEPLCTWDSLCALAQWYLCQIVRCVDCGHTRVLPDKKQNKDLPMLGEKRHCRKFLSQFVDAETKISRIAVLQRNARRETFASSCPRLECLMKRTGKWTRTHWSHGWSWGRAEERERQSCPVSAQSRDTCLSCGTNCPFMRKYSTQHIFRMRKPSAPVQRVRQTILHVLTAVL